MGIASRHARDLLLGEEVFDVWENQVYRLGQRDGAVLTTVLADEVLEELPALDAVGALGRTLGRIVAVAA